MVLTAGCVDSVMPIYTEDDLIFDPELVGFWATEDSSEVFVVTDGAERGYSVWRLDDECSSGWFVMHLASVEGVRFLDVRPVEPERNPGLMPLHAVWLLDRIDDSTISGRMLDHDWLRDHLRANPEAIAHLGGSRLTASTDELQRFYLAHVQTPGAFADSDRLIRLDEATAQRLIGQLILFAPPPPPRPPPPPPRSRSMPPGTVAVPDEGPPELRPCVI